MDKMTNGQVTMMTRIVEEMQILLERNIRIEKEISQSLTKIYPREEEKVQLIENECDFRDFTHEISYLLKKLHLMVDAHERNVKHLKQIV